MVHKHVSTAVVGLLAATAAATADSGVYTCGSMRVSVLTEDVVRVEVDSNTATPAFNAAPTMFAVNRDRAAPTHHKVVNWGTSDSQIVLQSGVIGQFDCTHATRGTTGFYRFFDKAKKPLYVYMQSDPAQGNLYGTVRTLDHEVESVDLNCAHLTDAKSPQGDAASQHCTYGVASTSGWAVLNDTNSAIFAKAGGDVGGNIYDENVWFAPNPAPTTEDLYFFLHGPQRHREAVKDFVKIGGNIPLLPRYALGTMFTRWYDYDEQDLKEVVREFGDRRIPLDVMIVDMNWHRFGAWGAYSYNVDNYPNPQHIRDYLAEKGLRFAANLHDADGVSKEEPTHDDMCKAVGVDEKQCGDLPFSPTNRVYMQALQDTVLKGLENTEGELSRGAGKANGFDFWWTDWQQGETTFNVTEVPNLNPTFALNHLRFSDPIRRQEARRSLVMGRFGGAGSHRYAFGFSGDQKHDWAGLQFLPYFTSTAANVGFQYWSHDVYGGHQGQLATDAELGTRWIQQAALSPIFRFHDKGEGTGGCANPFDAANPTGTCSKIYMWDHPSQNYRIELEAMRLRHVLLPYIYSQAFEAASTGSPWLRPLYWDAPTDENAMCAPTGSQPNQGCVDWSHYSFGDAFVAAPVTNQSVSGVTSWHTYLPAGLYVDLLSGSFLVAPTSYNVTHQVTLEETYLALRARVAVPVRRPEEVSKAVNSLGLGSQVPEVIQWVVVPVEGLSNGTLYEDDMTDGNAPGSALPGDNTVSTLTVTASHGDASTVKVDVGLQQVAKGKGAANPTQKHAVRLLLTGVPLSVSAGCGAVSFSTDFFDVPSIVVQMPLTGGKAACTVSVNASDIKTFHGLAGAVRKARAAKSLLDFSNIKYGHSDRGALTKAGLAIESLHDAWKDAEAHSKMPSPAVLNDIAHQFWLDLSSGKQQVAKLSPVEATRHATALTLLTAAASYQYKPIPTPAPAPATTPAPEVLLI